MSQEKVRTETVQTWFEAFTDDPDAFRHTLHPEIEWFPFEDNHSATHGVDGAMRIRAHWLESWEVDARLHFHFKLWDDKVVYIYEHLDKGKALEAAGLSE